MLTNNKDYFIIYYLILLLINYMQFANHELVESEDIDVKQQWIYRFKKQRKLIFTLTSIIVILLLIIIVLIFSPCQSVQKLQKPTQIDESQKIVKMREEVTQQLNKNLSNTQAFKKIYETNFWEPTGKNPSGPGSVPQINKEYLAKLQQLIDHPKIKRIVEVGFGDFILSSQLKIPADKLYIGYDVVESLMRKNETNRKFKMMKDIYEFDQEGDLLIEKDVIMHWPNKAVEYFLTKVVPRFRYALLTNDQSDSPRKDIFYGQYSPLYMKDYNPKEFVYKYDHHQQQKYVYIIPKWPE